MTLFPFPAFIGKSSYFSPLVCQVQPWQSYLQQSNPCLILERVEGIVPLKIGSTDPEKERKGRTFLGCWSESQSCSWHGSTVTMIIGKERRRCWGKETTPRFAHSRRVVKEQESAPLEPTILVSFLARGCSVESSVQLDGIVAQPRILGESISFSPYTGSDS